MKRIFLVILILSLLNSCKKDDNNQLSALVTNKSTCHSQDNKAQDYLVDLNQSCVIYSYNPITKQLLLTHANAGFNCCPGKISCNINLTGNTITLTEREESSGCNCLCIYDIDIEINNLEAAEYIIKFVEPYRGNQDELSNIINLNTTPTGEFCSTRTDYPWGIIE